jgi:hypothetical protein
MGMQAPPVIGGNQIDLRGLFYSVIDWGGVDKVYTFQRCLCAPRLILITNGRKL